LTLKGLAFSNQKFSSIVTINSRNVEIMAVFVSLPTGGGDPIPPSGHITEAIRLANVDDGTVSNVTVDGGFFGELSIGDPQVSKGLIVEDSAFANVGSGLLSSSPPLVRQPATGGYAQQVDGEYAVFWERHGPPDGCTWNGEELNCAWAD
jgi:hypothetical protein